LLATHAAALDNDEGLEQHGTNHNKRANKTNGNERIRENDNNDDNNNNHYSFFLPLSLALLLLAAFEEEWLMSCVRACAS
jgi:hypothetical protein